MGQITIDPTSDLSLSTSYYVAFPAGAYKDILDTTSTVGISTYSFETEGVSGPGPYELYTSGGNSEGHLGQNNQVQYSSPKQIPGTQWSFANSSLRSQYAIKTDGTLWAWGDGYSGEIAQNNIIDYSSPTQIPGTQWSKVNTGRQSTAIATKTDGTLWAWGDAGSGNLAQNDTITRSSPAQIPGTQWVLARTHGNDGGYSRYAFKTDGTMWIWGGNNGLYTGLNSNVAYSSPVQIPGTWQYEDGKFTNGQAKGGIKTDGTLWVWGSTSGGRLGLNDDIPRSSPKQIPGTQWTYISFCQQSFGIKTDGTLWAWGIDSGGGLGLNNSTTGDRSSPTQLPGTQWETISNGNYHTVATKTDGSIWVWGANSTGRLGLNNLVQYSSPVQVPGTSWVYAVAAEDDVMWLKNA